MRFSLAATALAATFALGSCDFPCAFLQRRGEADAESSSSFHSFSWFRGQDGQMHQQTKTSSTEIAQDGSELTKNTLCKDGDCREVIQILQAPTMQDPMQSEGDNQNAAQLRGILGRLIEQMQYQRNNRYEPERQPEIIIERFPMQQPQFPEISIELRPFTFPDAPRSRGLPEPDDQRISFGRFHDSHPGRKEQQEAQAVAEQASDMKLIKLGVALIALAAAYAMVMLVLKCWRVDQVSARERPLRDLAEPLAPAEVNVAIPGAVTSTKLDPLRMYLSGLYARSNAKSEARGVTTYMARLYTKIFA